MRYRADMRRYGVDWKRDGEGWRGRVHGRFEVHTWPFGSIHQCKVMVDYPRPGLEGFDQRVGVCLRPGKTRDESMRHGLAWVDRYRVEGPPSADAVVTAAFANWKTLFRTRVDLIDHLFFKGGNGYDWLDGALYELSAEDHQDYIEATRVSPEELARRRAEHAELNASLARIRDRLVASAPDPIARESILETFRPIGDHVLEEADLPVGPVPDAGKPRAFGWISPDFARIGRVPHDVRPEWFELAYEAAVVLRDRSAEPENRALGRELVADLERRFPQWLDRAVKALARVG